VRAVRRPIASGITRLLAGPTGERNSYAILPREHVLCLAEVEGDLLTQLAAVLAVAVRRCGRKLN
jgi:RHH-type proline utilization regulon transcriptional repressor/proline dehydrogenase/delta 1-pyrroline-5-carboxylate dehydrogenase